MSGFELVKRLGSASQSAALKVRVRSALNPVLWLAALMTPTCFGFALAFDGGVRLAMIIFGATPIATACAGFAYFALCDPDKLQSEDYQLRKMALELIEEKGSRVPIEPASVEAITNPLHRGLPPATEIGGEV